jgi:D-alanine-D-alanine ligase
MSSAPKRFTLVVLFGGRSAEHDVSCVTAAHVIRAADPDKYQIVVVAITRDGDWVRPSDIQEILDNGSKDIPSSLTAAGDPCSPSFIQELAAKEQVVVVPLLHGPLGEDGTLQGLLEILDVAYVGSGVLASAVSMDKIVSKQLLEAQQIPVCKWRGSHVSELNADTVMQIVAELSLPIFVKPANMGSSVGISKAKTLDEVLAATQLASEYDEWIIFEEAVAGREIEVSVLGNLTPRASIAGEIIPSHEFYDYEDKYVTDGAQLLIPAPLADDDIRKVQDLAIRAYKALRCEGMARVDFFFEEDRRGFLCNEINTIPGFTPISMYPKLWNASGINYVQLIDELVSLALERHTRSAVK